MTEEYYLNQSLQRDCFKLPDNDKKYLLIKNFLSEYFSEQDKAQVLSNLGVTALINELRELILAKLFNEEGSVTFDLEPHENAYSKVLSSAVIYRILLNYYTKEQLDEWREELVDEIHNRIQEIENSTIHVDNELNDQSEHPVQNKVLHNIISQIIDDQLGISQQIEDTNRQIEQLNQDVSGIPRDISINVDNKTIQKENQILSTLLTLRKLPQQQINDESIKSIYELQNADGEKIGDRIVINKCDDYSQVIEQLQQQIQQLQREQQKYIIIDESAYEQLTEYVHNAIYLVLEDGESIDTSWKFGDRFPIILSGGESNWKFGDNFPIVLSGDWKFGDSFPIILPETQQEESNIYNGYEYVDLGLPSGTMWAKCNIGATEETEYGDIYNWNNITSTINQIMTGWNIPTREQCEELLNNTTCTQEKNSNNLVIGYRLTSRTNPSKSIFFPGMFEEYYWTSTPIDEESAETLCFTGEIGGRIIDQRYEFSLPIRPVFNR